MAGILSLLLVLAFLVLLIEYQRKVLAHLLSILPITGGTPSTSSTSSTTNNNEEEPPRSRFN